jgi:hypothetical protein
LRILLDENMPPEVVPILTALGHPTVYSGTEHPSAVDQALVPVASAFDLFITLDLHRQEAEWIAVHRALIEGNIRVVRIRLPKRFDDEVLEVTRSLILKMEAWMAEIRAGKCLVIISDGGNRIRARTRREVLTMLDKRSRR